MDAVVLFKNLKLTAFSQFFLLIVFVSVWGIPHLIKSCLSLRYDRLQEVWHLKPGIPPPTTWQALLSWIELRRSYNFLASFLLLLASVILILQRQFRKRFFSLHLASLETHSWLPLGILGLDLPAVPWSVFLRRAGILRAIQVDAGVLLLNLGSEQLALRI